MVDEDRRCVPCQVLEHERCQEQDIGSDRETCQCFCVDLRYDTWASEQHEAEMEARSWRG